jgi:hypothetical protein
VRCPWSKQSQKQWPIFFRSLDFDAPSRETPGASRSAARTSGETNVRKLAHLLVAPTPASGFLRPCRADREGLRRVDCPGDRQMMRLRTPGRRRSKTASSICRTGRNLLDPFEFPAPLSVLQLLLARDRVVDLARILAPISILTPYRMGLSGRNAQRAPEPNGRSEHSGFESMGLVESDKGASSVVCPSDIRRPIGIKRRRFAARHRKEVRRSL